MSCFRIGVTLMVIAALCVFAPCFIPIGFAGVLGGHFCLYLGYLLTVIGDRKLGRKFDWIRLFSGFFIWCGLVIMGPLTLAAIR